MNFIPPPAVLSFRPSCQAGLFPIWYASPVFLLNQGFILYLSICLMFISDSIKANFFICMPMTSLYCRANINKMPSQQELHESRLDGIYHLTYDVASIADWSTQGIQWLSMTQSFIAQTDSSTEASRYSFFILR